VASPHCADCFEIALSMETFLFISESSGELSYIIKKMLDTNIFKNL